MEGATLRRSLLVMLELVAAASALDWWQTGVIYQIYPRSFKDSDGDGVGDLNGITQEVDYVAGLGVGAVWLSPIFQSPMADFGYDVSDYRAIDPLFGTMDDFLDLLTAFHERGIKVLLDLVPNHTSDEHEWFGKSAESEEPFTDYYVWAEAKWDQNGTRLPPCNWLSAFGGSAWTWNERRQKYYLHQYHRKQPDLNYRNPLVLQELNDVIRFWLNLGVDGFRVDTVATLLEDDRFLDEPRSFWEGVPADDYQYLNHIYTTDQPGSYDVIYEFRGVLDLYRELSNYSKFMTVEAYTSLENTMRWYGNETIRGAHFPFNFIILEEINQGSNASDWSQAIQDWYKAMPNGCWANWVIGNHDNHRAATRFGRDFMDSLHMIQFILPGTVVTYMGDEIAMQDAYVSWSETADPQGLNAGKERFEEKSRDPERSPFQWNSSVSAGFSSNSTTWLPVNADFWDSNAAAQADKKSHLSVFKSLVALKRLPVLQQGSLRLWSEGDVLVIARDLEQVSYVAVVNVGHFQTTFNLSRLLPLPGQWRVYASSLNCEHQEGQLPQVESLILRPKAGLVLSNDTSIETQLERPPTQSSPSSSAAAIFLRGSSFPASYLFPALFFFATKWNFS
nr:PREDICTED: maltase A3-like [Bemisia tabaci]